MVVALHIHRRKGEWPPFEPPQAPLYQIFTAIGQYRRLQRGFVHTYLDGGMMIVVDSSWLPTVGPHWTRCGVWGQAKTYEVFHAIALHNGHHGLTEGRHRLKAPFPAPALVESLNLRQRLGHPTAQRRLGRLRMPH